MTTKILNANGMTILKKITEKNGQRYVFYDICISNIISVMGAKIVEGKNGYFLSMPSQKSGDKYYPVVSMDRKISDEIVKILTDKSTQWADTDLKSLVFRAEKTETKTNSNDDYPF